MLSQRERSEAEPPAPTSDLRTYKAPWRGELLLACKKCQRKIDKPKALANIKKWFKKHDAEVRVVGADCIKMCPKAGVTVIRQHQFCESGREVSILRSKDDLNRLSTLLTRDASIKRAS